MPKSKEGWETEDNSMDAPAPLNWPMLAPRKEVPMPRVIAITAHIVLSRVSVCDLSVLCGVCAVSLIPCACVWLWFTII